MFVCQVEHAFERVAYDLTPDSPYLERMPNRTAWIAVGAAAAIALVVGLAIGAFVFAEDTSPPDAATTLTTLTTVAVDSVSSSTIDKAGVPADTPTDSTAPPSDGLPPTYGTDEERQALLDVAEGLGITGVFSDPDLLLATADKICHDLERLIAQGRTAAYATRVVWNESLAELESEDLAGFATVFSLAPTYLCPDSAAYARDVAYILGI